jgi:hypothetical protein
MLKGSSHLGTTLADRNYEGVSKSSQTELITKSTTTTTTTNTRWEATQRVMAAKLTRLTHNIAIQLHLVAESCIICSSRSKLPVRKLLDTPSYIQIQMKSRMHKWATWQLLQFTNVIKVIKSRRTRWADRMGRWEIRVGREGLDWIRLAQGKDQWPALVNTVMNLRFP